MGVIYHTQILRLEGNFEGQGLGLAEGGIPSIPVTVDILLLFYSVNQLWPDKLWTSRLGQSSFFQLWETVRALVRLNIMEGRAPLARFVSSFSWISQNDIIECSPSTRHHRQKQKQNVISFYFQLRRHGFPPTLVSQLNLWRKVRGIFFYRSLISKATQQLLIRHKNISILGRKPESGKHLCIHISSQTGTNLPFLVNKIIYR